MRQAASEILILLSPRFRSVVNQGRISSDRSNLFKYLLIGVLGAGFWGGSLYVSLKVLRYFSQIEELGDILAFKLLSMIVVTIFSLMIFSNILNALSKLYLAKDLKLVHSMPVEGYRIFLARITESTFDSSWMVILYTLPVFVAYGIIFGGSLFYYVITIFSLILLSVAASAAGAILVMAAVIVVPASRIRTLFVFLGLSLFILLYIAFRILRPERLVDPEVFSATLFYFKSMSTPSSPFLPFTWCYDALTSALKGDMTGALFHISISLSFSLFSMSVTVIIADLIYFSGVSKAQTSAARLLGSRRLSIPFTGYLSGPVRALFDKEVRTFFRDQTQWSQLFLIGALICIYIYNFKVLPLERSPIQTVYLQNILAFLNMGLAFFVLIAVTGRFAFPAISMEGEAIWIIRSSPVDLKSFILIKYSIYLVPLMLLTFILIIGTNLLLKVVPFMMILSCIDTLLIVPGVLSVGVGLGAAYPAFKSENPAQSVTSYGGLLFMIISALFVGTVIILQAGPVYTLLYSQFRHKALASGDIVWIVAGFAGSLVVSLAAAVLPMKFGERRLRAMLYGKPE